MDLRLAGNAAVVTASTRGLGKASAAALLREGANVTVCGRTPERLAGAREDLAAVGPGSVNAVRADVTDPDDVATLIERPVAEFGGIDHLVTSAGVPQTGSFRSLSPEEWYDAFDLLVMGAVYAIDAAAPHLEASAVGSIVTIASRTVQEVVPGMALSNSVRRSVIGLTKTVARDRVRNHLCVLPAQRS